MAEPSIAGLRAEGEKLSPDGSKVLFLWNAESKAPSDVYLVPTDGSAAPVRLFGPRELPVPAPSPTPDSKLDYGLVVKDEFVKMRENQVGNLEWSPDSNKFLFTQNGDLFLHVLIDAKPNRIFKTQSSETGARFLDSDRILYLQGGNIFVLDTRNAAITQLSKEANPQNFISIFAVTPSKDGSMVAYVVSDGSKQKTLFVPNYLNEFTAAPSIRRGWTEQKVLAVATDGNQDTPFELKLPKPEGASSFRRMVWAADNKSLIVDRNDDNTKRRQLFYVKGVGSKLEQTLLVTEETDPKWQAPLSTIFEPNPKDSSELFFGSERDGFNHLYLAKLQQLKVEPNPSAEIRAEGIPSYSSDVIVTQLTRGKWQVEWARWDPKNRQIIMLSTKRGPRSRTFSMITADGKNVAPFDDTNPIRELGMVDSLQLAESSEFDFPQVIYGYSRWNEPTEIVAEKLCFSCSASEDAFYPIRLTRTTPESFRSRHWIEPKFIEIPSRDGKKIFARIYVPAGHSAKKKYSMVVFVHGAGYLQNVINGWNNYYREFMFNDLLARSGYVVLDIDYRGSAGYGRDWRTDVYDFLGGKDMDDHVDAIDFMVANYGVAKDKVGVYGGSYGGFMAGMLAMRAPERIAAAAALRPVFDWKNYFAANPGYTAQRLGFPDKNPEAYKRSSPISYADKLERPLLILHGMSDDNVHVQDSVQLMEKLIRLGKTRYFESMLYPSENHGFSRPESWSDEYERILAFFQKYLK
ncbi:MAG: alpha/beta fold hydrolase [Pyrinomonadaceae bacterium]